MKKITLLFLIIFPLFAHGQISISNLNEATTINSSDLFLLTQGSSSKKLKYNTLQTKLLLNSVFWNDTLTNGKIPSKYYVYTQLLPKINWSDTLSPNGKLLKFVNNHGGTGTLDSSKLVTRYNLQTGIKLPIWFYDNRTKNQYSISGNGSAVLLSSMDTTKQGSFNQLNHGDQILWSKSYKTTKLIGMRIDTSNIFFYNRNLSTNKMARIDSLGRFFSGNTTANDSILATRKYVNNHTLPINSNGDVTITGLLTYKYCHGIASANGLTYAPNLTQNVPFKLLPGMTVVDTVGVKIAADSAKLLYAGDWRVRIFSNISSSANDDFTIQLRVNNSLVTTSAWQGTTSGATNYLPVFFEWYLHNVTVNSYLSFRIVNTTNNNDPTIRYFKLDIDKVPE